MSIKSPIYQHNGMHFAKRCFCSTLQRTATHFEKEKNIYQHLNMRFAQRCFCNTLQHTATHFQKELCNYYRSSTMICILQSAASAAHCNTLQHTATHCNTLPRPKTLYIPCIPAHWYAVRKALLLQHTAPHHTKYTTLHHTAPHFPSELYKYFTYQHSNLRFAQRCFSNTLHHTATHCNTLQTPQHTSRKRLYIYLQMGWLRFVGSLKL